MSGPLVVAVALERLLKQPVVLNKPGAAGAVGNQFAATSKPDGYTLLMALVSEPEVVNAHAKLATPIAYMDADEFNDFCEKDARRLAEVVEAIGKVESAK